MAHEILTVKLYELDKKIAQIHSRIQLSEMADRKQIEADLKVFQRECAENRMVLRNRLKYSKAEIVRQIYESYEKIENIIRETKDKICGSATEKMQEDLPIEERILLAEYILDFAMQAADEALLISMEAICIQMKQEERNDD